MDLLGLIFYFLIIIPSSIIHEYAHGWMADRLGDPTARYAGRLTLDPRSHIDLMGTILIPLLLFVSTGGRFLFAYAKPVPFNPNNLRYHRWGPALVGVAGPLANLLLAASFALVFRFMPLASIAPLLAIVVYANVLLLVFNLLPIPPLDGSKILFALLPDTYAMNNFKYNFEKYGFIIVLVLIFSFFRYLAPLIYAITEFLGGRLINLYL